LITAPSSPHHLKQVGYAQATNNRESGISYDHMGSWEVYAHPKRRCGNQTTPPTLHKALTYLLAGIFGQAGMVGIHSL
jgi:hypothetical protein